MLPGKRDSLGKNKKPKYDFSLVLPTINRVDDLKRFFEALVARKGSGNILPSVEVILVDQNKDDRLAGLVKTFGKRIRILHCRMRPQGLSKARNLGIRKAAGKYVAFPDDDCFYHKNTLAAVMKFFEGSVAGKGLFIRGVDPETGEDFLSYPPRALEIRSPRESSVFLGISISQFYPFDLVKRMGGFDENLGLGGVWGSGEETDFAIRFLKSGHPICFRPEILVYHRKINPLKGSMSLEKVRGYSLGFGALCKKHGLGPLWIGKTLKQVLGAVYFMVRFDWGRAQMCWATAKGRWDGYWAYAGGGK